MSNSDAAQKAMSTLQLKKDLNQAVKILQNLTTSLGKVESSLVDSEAARATEHRYNERLSQAHRELNELQTRYRCLEDDHQREVVAFATANLRLNQEFDARLKQNDEEHASKSKEVQALQDTQEQTLSQKINSLKGEVRRLKEQGTSRDHHFETKFREERKNLTAQVDARETQMKVLREMCANLSRGNGSLTEDLQQHQTILKGRETEISRLKARLSALETFGPYSVDEWVQTAYLGTKSRLMARGQGKIDSHHVAEQGPGILCLVRRSRRAPAGMGKRSISVRGRH